MRFVKPRRALSGFHADLPDPQVPELLHIGEQWLPDDYPIPRHAHSVWEFYLQLDGTSLWRDAAGQGYRCPPGAFFAPPPKSEHWLERTSRSRHHFLFAAIDVDAVVRTRLPMVAPTWAPRRVVHVVRGTACEATFRQLIRETVTDRAFRTAGLRAAVDALVIDASRLVAGAAAAEGRPLVPVHPAVETARAALDAHPSESWRLAELAKLAGVSPNHLVKLFSDHVGESPHHYLLRRRVQRAMHMLRHTDAPITTIAHELGFNSSQHFARVFKQAAGTTASAYRA